MRQDDFNVVDELGIITAEQMTQLDAMWVLPIVSLLDIPPVYNQCYHQIFIRMQPAMVAAITMLSLDCATWVQI